MKKIMAVVLALFVFAAFSFLAGCKKAEQPKAPEPAKEAAPEPAQPAAPAK
jgi:ABC-type oligopeptide transport system substrate-binding subunit